MFSKWNTVSIQIPAQNGVQMLEVSCQMYCIQAIVRIPVFGYFFQSFYVEHQILDHFFHNDMTFPLENWNSTSIDFECPVFGSPLLNVGFWA